jgi:hypothetical protein
MFVDLYSKLREIDDRDDLARLEEILEVNEAIFDTLYGEEEDDERED